MYLDTKIDTFCLLNQASASVTAGETAATTTYALTNATAVVHTNRPSNCYTVYKADAANAFVGALLLQDLAGDGLAGADRTAEFTLWGWSPGYSGGVKLMTIMATCGTSVIGTAAAPGVSPADGSALTGQWGYVDEMSITTNNIDGWTLPVSGIASNAICQFAFDPRGMQYLFGDWDCDAGSGTTPDDAMAIIRPY